MNQPPCHLVLFWSCFNGAATLSLRKLDQEPQAVRDLVALQWGRNFIVAEMSHRSANWPTGATLQWGRNFIVAEMSSDLHARKLQWGRNFVVAEEKAHRASMGPQLYRCGNVTERAASMGPQLCRCGNGDPSLSACCASMGPQLYRCGNLAVVSTVPTRHEPLQWGRNFIVAEICQRR